MNILRTRLDSHNGTLIRCGEVGAQAGVSASILEELVDLLTKCEYHRFAPVPLHADERHALIARAEAVISNIEDLLITDN